MAKLDMAIDLEEIRQKIIKCVRVKEIKSEIGIIFLLKIGKTKISLHLTKDEADKKAELMRTALSNIICKSA